MSSPSVVSLALAAMAVAVPAPARAQVRHEIRGSVHHLDGRPLADAPVVLEVYDGQQILQSLESVTDGEGNAVFADVQANAENVARLGAHYGGIVYYSDPVILGSETVRDLAVTVTEVSSEGHPLHLETLHIIVQIDDPTRYQVLEFATVSNAGEMAWAGGPPLADGTPSGLVIPLPSGATEVRPAPFPSAADAIPADAIPAGEPGPYILDPRPVPPSGRQVALTYVLEAGDDGADLQLTLPYPAASVSVLVGGAAVGAVEFHDSNLERGDPQQIGDQQYEVWSATSLSPDTEILLGIGPRTQLLSPEAWGLIGLGLALAGAVVASFKGLRPGPDAEQLREEILRRIARLDLEHEAGSVDDAEYQRRRGEDVERLLTVQSWLDAGAVGDAQGETATDA